VELVFFPTSDGYGAVLTKDLQSRTCLNEKDATSIRKLIEEEDDGYSALETRLEEYYDQKWS
jgi:hypothetical protein